MIHTAHDTTRRKHLSPSKLEFASKAQIAFVMSTKLGSIIGHEVKAELSYDCVPENDVSLTIVDVFKFKYI